MHVEVNGARLWFDVDGPSLTPDGRGMRERPTVVLVHGGPATYDHSYFKPHFVALTDVAQVVYLDLPGHGRSSRHDPAIWNLEVCADALRDFCDTVGIVAPIVYGHSMGGAVAMLYGARHAGHARALIVQSSLARFDLARLVDGFRRAAGDRVAELARRDYSGDAVTDHEWAEVFRAFGPNVPSADELARRAQQLDLASAGMDRLRSLDLTDQLRGVNSPTLVSVGTLDPVTPVAASEEIVAALPPGVGRLHVLDGAGHFPWLDLGERYWSRVASFVQTSA